MKKPLSVIFLVIFLFGVGILPKFHQFEGNALSLRYNVIEHNGQNFFHPGIPEKNVYTLFLREKEDQGLITSIGFALFNFDGQEYLSYMVFVNIMDIDYRKVKSSLNMSDKFVSALNLTEHYIPGQISDEVTLDSSYKQSKPLISQLFAINTNFNPNRKTSLNWFVILPKDLGRIRNKSGIEGYKLMIQDKEYVYKFDEQEAEIVYDLINMFPCTDECALTEKQKSEQTSPYLMGEE